MHGAKEGDREGYREGVREREGKENKIERKRNTHNLEWKHNGPSIKGRDGLMLKLNELVWPSMTF